MNILMIHNFYQYPGGEDQSYRSEFQMLRHSGHKMSSMEYKNQDLENKSQISNAINTIWSESSRRRVERFVADNEIEIVHFQNTFPQVSPSAYWGAKKKGATVIQALRNYRLTCVNGLLYTQGSICQICVGKSAPYYGIAKKCYRDSGLASMAVASMIGFNKIIHSYDSKVDMYIAVSQFVKEQYVKSGISEQKIAVKPNFINDPGELGSGNGEYFIYVGRITSEKGILTLLAAWEGMSRRKNLKIVGQGPLLEFITKKYAHISEIEILGHVDHAATVSLMANACAIIVPSEWHEPFGRVVVEAYAVGTPVISTRIGGLGELVVDNLTGMQFNAGDIDDLREKVEGFCLLQNSWREMRKAARHQYDMFYTEKANYEALIKIYSIARRDDR